MTYTGSPLVDAVSIPNRPAFRAQEVCEIAGVPPFVLRGWEAEFPDLGVAKSPGSPRTYRRADVEQVLRLKRLILVEGLTLAGVRRRLAEEAEEAEEAEAATAAEGAVAGDPAGPLPPNAAGAGGLDDSARAHLVEVRRGLQWVLDTLGGPPAHEFVLAADPQPPRGGRSRSRKK